MRWVAYCCFPPKLYPVVIPITTAMVAIIQNSVIKPRRSCSLVLEAFRLWATNSRTTGRSASDTTTVIRADINLLSDIGVSSGNREHIGGGCFCALTIR